MISSNITLHLYQLYCNHFFKKSAALLNLKYNNMSIELIRSKMTFDKTLNNIHFSFYNYFSICYDFLILHMRSISQLKILFLIFLEYYIFEFISYKRFPIKVFLEKSLVFYVKAFAN